MSLLFFYIWRKFKLMNKFIAMIAIALFSTLAFSQQKEKVKGSKIVTVVQKEIAEFESLEVSDNLEIFLIKGDKCSLEMEADDNVQQFIEYSSKGKTLQLFTSRQISGTKMPVLAKGLNCIQHFLLWTAFFRSN